MVHHQNPSNLERWIYLVSYQQQGYQAFHLPAFWVVDGVAEHVEEGGLEEVVEFGEGLMANNPQRVRRVENPRNPLLLLQRRQRQGICRSCLTEKSQQLNPTLS